MQRCLPVAVSIVDLSGGAFQELANAFQVTLASDIMEVHHASFWSAVNRLLPPGLRPSQRRYFFGLLVVHEKAREQENTNFFLLGSLGEESRRSRKVGKSESPLEI